MEQLKVYGGTPLRGSVSISGAKNSALALLPAAILADEPVILDNIPRIQDVQTYTEILSRLGVDVHREADTLILDPSRMLPQPLNDSNIKKIRASYYLMGALLGRFREAAVGMPGGDDLGPRPIDQHIKGFEALGAQVEFKGGLLYLRAHQLRGARIYLDVVSVGATLNIMLAATMAEGQTLIENAAKEPEIVDVATLLNAMGARISGAGTDVIRIEGVNRLHGCRHEVIPDRIECGTYLIAAAATGGEIWIENVIPKHVESVIAKLHEMGIPIQVHEDSLHILPSSGLRAVDVKTYPYPGFPTDLQQPMTVLLTQAEGHSLITDNIYSSRFRHVEELQRMGAHIHLEGRTAVVVGKTPLLAAPVQVHDVRAGAALVIAGLVAEGATEISGVEHIDRGYEAMEEKLRGLGARIWRQQLPAQQPK